MQSISLLTDRVSLLWGLLPYSQVQLTDDIYDLEVNKNVFSETDDYETVCRAFRDNFLVTTETITSKLFTSCYISSSFSFDPRI